MSVESAELAGRLSRDLGGSLRDLGVDGIRAFVGARMPTGRPAMHAVEELDLETRHGPVSLRVYVPGPDPTGTVLYLHGGGWVAGGFAGHDDLCRTLAQRTGCSVVAVDYPLSPEHRHPVAIDACADVLAEITAGALAAVDPSQVVLAGDSAGASIAAVLAAMGHGAVVGQLLVYPVCDYVAPGADGPASWRSRGGPLLDVEDMDWFFAQHLPAGPTAVQMPMTVSWGQPPPTLIVLAGHDPLRDGGLELASMLAAKGGEVEVIEHAGTFHGFFPLVEALQDARDAVEHAGTFVARLMTRSVDAAGTGDRRATAGH